MNLTFSTEVQLVIAAVAFYFYESSVLLFANEALASPVGRNRWQVKIGASGFKLGNKYLFFPNFIFLHRPVFRLSWDLHDLEVKISTDLEKRRKLLFDFRYVVYGAATTIFVLLPFNLFFLPSHSVLLANLFAIYLNSAYAAFLLLKKSGDLEGGPELAKKTALECLLCPPITINLIRRLSINAKIQITTLAACYSYSDEFMWAQSKVHLIEILEQAIEEANAAELELLLAAKELVLGRVKNDND